MKKTLLLSTCLLLASFLHSQSWRNQADSLVINHIFADKVGRVDIFAFSEMLSIADTIILADGSILQVPYSSCYGYFVDNQPFANWSHPCKYCFVDISMNHTVMAKDMPPKGNHLTSISLCPRSIPTPKPVAVDTTFIRNYRTSDTDHKWAVLICANGSETRFWFDLSSVYTVLANVYGYQEGWVWDNYADRRIIVTGPNELKSSYLDGLNSSDLNGNGHGDHTDGNGDFFNWHDDYYTCHSKNNMENIFKCFAGDEVCLQHYADQGLRELTEEDQLFVFITGHGKRDNYGSYFPVDEQHGGPTRVYDTTFVRWLRNIKCSQMTLLMQNCYSGAFVEKFVEDISDPACLCKNRIGQSASSSNEKSWSEGYGVYSNQQRSLTDTYANEFLYYWTSAALGYYPFFRITNDVVDEGPWTPNRRIIGSGNMIWEDYFGQYPDAPSHEDYDVNPDTDGDEILSFNELFEFANNLDTWSPQGYYFPPSDSVDDFNPEHPQQRYESTFTKEAATLAGYQGQIDSITDSGTAMQPYRLCGDIWISPDSQLTMFDNIQSPKDVKIYIKPSGKMTLDGGTLTNLPEENSPMWKGVQVWGDANKSQRPKNGRHWQGYFELKNGAAIENAITGIDVWKPEDENSTGGIVVASDASFVNNTTAVFFHPYENKQESANQPGTYTIRDNMSSFKNCVFSIDNNYIGPDLFEMHVNLFRVRGVKFLGCDFWFRDNFFSKPWPIGVHAWDAGFHIRGLCMPNVSPCVVYDKSTFDGFYKAVASVTEGAIGLRPITDFMWIMAILFL